ncbi:MAG: glutaredoxin [Christensenellales bacterium]
MKQVLMFVKGGCPFCRAALNWMQEACAENPRYREISVKIVDELEEPQYADQFDYYLVPTYYVQDDKVHEGIASKKIVTNVFERALEE